MSGTFAGSDGWGAAPEGLHGVSVTVRRSVAGVGRSARAAGSAVQTAGEAVRHPLLRAALERFAAGSAADLAGLAADVEAIASRLGATAATARDGDAEAAARVRGSAPGARPPGSALRRPLGQPVP